MNVKKEKNNQKLTFGISFRLGYTRLRKGKIIFSMKQTRNDFDEYFYSEKNLKNVPTFALGAL